ncbi:MAG: type III pantothenate kinase [Arenimonas sp.]
MSLLIDCGNTRCKIARLLANGTLSPVIAIPLDTDDFLSQLNRELNRAVENESCYFASVANAGISTMIEAAVSAAGFSLHRVRTQPEALGMRIAYPKPEQLGVDRFLALLAAHQNKKHVLMVSVGSALTVDVLAADGQHHGGMISATESIVRHAMENRFENFKNCWGSPVGFSDNTSDALASGARYMVLGIIEKSWREASQLLNEPNLALLITGGDAEALLPYLPDNTAHRPSLVLEGLALWAGYQETH